MVIGAMINEVDWTYKGKQDKNSHQPLPVTGR